MHLSKFSVALMVSVVLAGCGGVFDDKDDSDGQPVTVAPMPSVVSSAPVASPVDDGCCHPSASPSSDPVCEWHPLEGHLVRAGDLVMDLKRKLARDPSHTEMRNHIQSTMGLSTLQAEKVLEELGL